MESVEDIEQVRELIGRKPLKILAKLQNCVALHNLTEIIEKSDGIMLERWSLSLNFSPAYLVFVQDYIINKCKLIGRPVIIASPIIESMSKKPIPTPSEAVDITVAITQGIDAFVLSTVTAQCESYIDSLKALRNICFAAETNLDPYKDFYNLEEYNWLPRFL